jgi:phage-related protein
VRVGRKRGGAGRKEAEPEQPKSWSIEEVTNARGERIVTRFVAALAGVNADEAKALLKALAERGNELRMPESKELGAGLLELRGSEVRIFYCFRSGRRIVLLDGMLKKRTDIPKHVLERLRKLVKRIA